MLDKTTLLAKLQLPHNLPPQPHKRRPPQLRLKPAKPTMPPSTSLKLLPKQAGVVAAELAQAEQEEQAVPVLVAKAAKQLPTSPALISYGTIRNSSNYDRSYRRNRACSNPFCSR